LIAGDYASYKYILRARPITLFKSLNQSPCIEYLESRRLPGLQVNGGTMFYRWRRFFRLLSRDVIVLWYACRNPATPKKIKLGAILIALYLISPIDLIPDFLLLFGWLDDFAIAAFLVPVLVRRVPESALQQANDATDRLLSRWRFGLGKS
jgi:uncharacterized membrane protein YkvA (DUF1232 family)